jgi:phosphatidylserine decarboxylase
MVIDGKIRVAVIPIAGHYYRRIICQVRPKEKVFRGQALGRIMLGSAVVVLLPVECEILVKPGEKVDAGKSVIGRITQPLRAKAGPIRP